MWEPHVENGRQVKSLVHRQSQHGRPVAKHLALWTAFFMVKQTFTTLLAIEICGFKFTQLSVTVTSCKDKKGLGKSFLHQAHL